MFMPAPLVPLTLQRYPQAAKPCIVAGIVILTTALIAASFCNTVNGLIATQGVVYAIGGVIGYFPGMQWINEWFIARRATAFAFVWAGAPLSGCITPFVMHWLLESYGYRTALRSYAVVLVRDNEAIRSSVKLGMKLVADSHEIRRLFYSVFRHHSSSGVSLSRIVHMHDRSITHLSNIKVFGGFSPAPHYRP